MMSTCNKNAHGKRASVVVVKSHLLSMHTKDFQHNAQDVNKDFALKEREHAFGGL